MSEEEKTEVVEDIIESEEIVKGEDDQQLPAVPEIVERIMPELGDTWEQLTPDKQADVMIRLGEIDKANTQQAVNPEKGAEGERQGRPSDSQIPLYDFDKINSEIAEKLDDNDSSGAAELVTSLLKDSYEHLRSMNDELSNQRDSRIPMDIQLALDNVKGATKDDIKAATAIIRSGRVKNKEDALYLAVMDRGGAVQAPAKSDPQRRTNSRRASQHGRDSHPGNIVVPFTNNDDDIRALKIAEAEAESRESQTHKR